ncbi:MAG: hypothetical protein ACYCUI_11520 [Vulcanimicrobiaceae bacterium]
MTESTPTSPTANLATAGPVQALTAIANIAGSTMVNELRQRSFDIQARVGREAQRITAQAQMANQVAALPAQLEPVMGSDVHAVAGVLGSIVSDVHGVGRDLVASLHGIAASLEADLKSLAAAFSFSAPASPAPAATAASEPAASDPAAWDGTRHG